MATVTRVIVLLWMDILAVYAMYVMMEYLTNVWDLGFTRAAAIINIFWGIVAVSPLFLKYIVDTIMGNYWVLCLSSISFSVGLGLLTMSTPPVLGNAMGTCRDYKPECIGKGQKILFYTALPLIAFGMSGHIASWNSFMAEQLIPQQRQNGGFDEEFDDQRKTFWKFFSSVFATIILTFVAVLGLPYINPWSLRFGIPAICTLVATLLFLSGSFSYKYYRPGGSPMTIFVRVFVTAACKIFERVPRDANELFEFEDPQIVPVPHTKSLRCLDKAAVIVSTKPLEGQVNDLWALCTVSEVEHTKTLIRMIPVMTTFILCGVVSSIGFTYFVEQLDHLSPKVGRLKVPSVILLWFFDQAQNLSAKLFIKLANTFAISVASRKLTPPLGIAVSMILAILCCITAARVEGQRLGVVRSHGLVGRPDETVPMTMFWLLPQFVLLGAFSGIFHTSATGFFYEQSPPYLQVQLSFVVSSVFGVGILGSVLSVFVVGKVSEGGGKMNWFQHDLNASRLDKYYWTLAWLMGVNLVVFVVVGWFYRYKETELRDQEGAELEGIDGGFDENAKGLLCCCC